MNKLTPYLDIIRPANLLIVAITQLAFQYFIIDPAFRSEGVFWALTPYLFAMLMLVTVLIAAGGYVVNDIFDQTSDQINKGQTIVGKIMSKNNAWRYYTYLVMVGALIAYGVANAIDQIHLFLIYPAAVVLLFLYSWKLKHMPLLGNIVVSSFIAIVIYILLFAERDGMDTLDKRNSLTYWLVYAYGIFFVGLAFLSNLAREILKDIEDMEGDRRSSGTTLPLVIGITKTKFFIIFIQLLVLLGCYQWFTYLSPFMEGSHKYYFLIFIVLSAALLLVLTLIANVKKDFSRLSLLYKIYMIFGLIYLFYFPL